MTAQTPAPTTALLDAIVEGLRDVKARHITLMDLRNIPNAVTDYFVIAHGTSRTQVEALARSVEVSTYVHLNETPWGRHGLRNGEWVILDFSNVVVHIFHEEVRPRYALEELWGDAEIKVLEEA